MDAFTIQNLTFSYPNAAVPALENITLTIEAGSFICLCGASGSGKSTLLRQLKPALAPYGARSGEILFENTPLDELDARAQSQKIGFVLQNPDNQLVTDKVWHELAFGLESLGCDTPTIRRRVAEMASFFGIEDWFYRPVSELSGGQKQLLNLASIMVMQPSVLLLDEPTSQLDPIAATEFLSTLGRINRELGTAIVISEHRLEEVFPLCSRAVVLENGRILTQGTPQAVGETLKSRGHGMFAAMPAPMRIFAAVPSELPCPVTVGQGREWLARYSTEHPLGEMPPVEGEDKNRAETVLQVEDAWFKYGKNSPDVVKGLSLQVRRGELLAILGGNGTGKSTTLRLIAGQSAPYRGRVTVFGGSPGEMHGRIGLLPQDVQTLFLKKTVREDLLCVLPKNSPEREARVCDTAALCGLTQLLDRHPYDLSGGEQQRAALAKVLLLQPELLLLDEPTKGLDAEFKQAFARILRQLRRSGVCIVMVSHDIEFCAEYATRCALFFDGGVVTEGAPHAFFSGNSFYTTAANRMARAVLPGAVTVDDVILACGGTVRPRQDDDGADEGYVQPCEEATSAQKPDKLPLWRKLTALVSGAGALAILMKILSTSDLSALLSSGGLTAPAGAQLRLYAAMLLCLGVLAGSVSRKGAEIDKAQTLRGERRLPRRTTAALAVIALLIPVTIFAGAYYFGNRKYYLTSMLVLLECMLPFALAFESRRPRARELVLLAVLCALGVAARAAFFMLPGFKPVAAIVILSGVALGGEAGFLVGAVTMLASNMLFQQGPWTPFQMFAMGLIGFLAGVLFRKGLLRRTRVSLCVFGALSVLIVYGGIMNPASAILYQSTITKEILLAYYFTGFPVDLVHAAATALFLWVFSRPMLEKLDRIMEKYGLCA